MYQSDKIINSFILPLNHYSLKKLNYYEKSITWCLHVIYNGT